MRRFSGERESALGLAHPLGVRIGLVRVRFGWPPATPYFVTSSPITPRLELALIMTNRCLLALLFPMLGCFSAVAAEGTVDFNRDVRVILSDNCFRCHGPNEEDRKAGLRLDVREEAVGAGAILPEDPEGSELLARVTADDPYLVMPPPDTEKELTEREIETLRRWIAQGADYAEHWAFTPPRYPEIPVVRDPSWVRNPIDRFVLANWNGAA